MEECLTANFWLAVGQIIMIDILLGGHNAVVIALAWRKLPQQQTYGPCVDRPGKQHEHGVALM